MKPIIEFKNVSKKYDNSYEALRYLNLQIVRGEMVFLTGHSGAGKTTLLKLIALLEKATRGSVIVDGKRLDKLAKRQIPYLRRNIGLVLQDSQLLPDHTVYANIALPLIVAGFRYKEIGRNVRAALNMVGLLAKEKRLPQSLSIGEQQRVSIARAIVNRPPLLLADEPTGNLDPDLSVEIMKLFENLNQTGMTMLIASHDLGLLNSLRHRMLVLKDGSLIKDDISN